jgi:transposase-like protein
MTTFRRRSHQPDPVAKPLPSVQSGFDEKLVIATIYDHVGNATTRELSRELGVSNSTLARWMKEFPAINSAVREMRSYVDDAVESSLAKRAIGYEVTETSTSDGPKGVTTTEKNVHIAPDVGAAKFWLSNRRRESWADRQVVEIEGGLKVAIAHAAELLELDPSEWKDVTDA